MRIKTFRAPTFRDAIALVRAEFGPNAAVLHTREVRTGPFSRWFGQTAVEVAATPDASSLAERAAATGAVDGGPVSLQRPVRTKEPRFGSPAVLVREGEA